MARPEEYAQWIVDNQDLQGTPEFETVSRAYEQSKSTAATESAVPAGVETAAQLAAPAVTGAAYAAPTGLARVGNDIASAARSGLQAVAARPLMQTASDIAGIATHGVPYGSIAKGLLDPGSLTIGQTARGVMDVARAAPGYIANMAGPLARGAARVAGPAGMAYNLAEAYPYLQQADIGSRVQSGQLPQQIQTARQQQLSAPTPAPLSPQEARNLLMSGDQRTIDIYGGAQRLSQQAGTAPQMRQPAPQPNSADLDARIRAAAARRALMMGQQGQ